MTGYRLIDKLRRNTLLRPIHMRRLRPYLMRQIGLLGPERNTGRLDHLEEQAEIGQIETHDIPVVGGEPASSQPKGGSGTSTLSFMEGEINLRALWHCVSDLVEVRRSISRTNNQPFSGRLDHDYNDTSHCAR